MFAPRQRRIYKFFDGTKQRGIDPLEIEAALALSDVDWDVHNLNISLAFQTAARVKGEQPAIPGPDSKGEALATIKDGVKSAAFIAAEAQKAFKLTPYELREDGTEVGLTTEEMLYLYWDFLAWRANLANFTDPSQTPPPSTEGSDPTATGSGTDSTSTPPANSPDKPS